MEMLRVVLDIVVTGCVVVFGAAWLLGALYFGLREPSRMLQGMAKSMGARLILVAVVVVILIVVGPHRAQYAHALQFWQPELAVLGALVAVAATALLVWARWVLGTMWASVPLVQRGHRLVTSGPYALVRHPIYTGLLGLAFGAMLTYGFGVYLIVMALAIPFIWRRVRVEDRMMATTFGEEYTAYRGEVPALLPSLRRTPAPR
ncbi:MAG TPA: isoprenylcysteine carboxylmethyltransferase family protein [Streptosporangiaceae bacterium]|jgi:protein-S-isoprenylcysteine O-methyltransferase Ste14